MTDEDATEETKENAEEIAPGSKGVTKESADNASAKAPYRKPVVKKYGQLDHIAAYRLE